MKFDELRVLRTAEEISDTVWKRVSRWDEFARDVVGKQLARAADSIGANIAEAFGRYHYGEKLQFLYYARGSLYETKYWLNRAATRNLMSDADVNHLISELTTLAKQLNSFAGTVKSNRRKNKAVREQDAEYDSSPVPNRGELFAHKHIAWLRQTSNI